MEWLTIRCAHCQTTYKRKARSVAPGLSPETRRAMPCPHCFRLQPVDAGLYRWRRLGCIWLLVVPLICAAVAGLFQALGFDERTRPVLAIIALLAAFASVLLEATSAKGRYKMRAIRLMEAGELLDPDENPESLYQQAGRAVAAGDQATAAKLLYRVAALTPDRLEAWTELAQCLAAQGRFEEAFPALERALILNPESPLVWQAKAGCALSAGRFEEALRHLDHALVLTPEDSTVWANRAMVLQRLKQLPEAAESAAQAVELDPANPVNWLNRARLQEQVGEDPRESYLNFLARTDAMAARTDGPLQFRGVDLEARAQEVRAKLRASGGEPPALAGHRRLYLSVTAASLAESLLKGQLQVEYEEQAAGWTAADGFVVAYTQLPAGVSGQPVAPVEALDLAAGRGLVLDPGTAGERRWSGEELAALREDVLLSR